MITIKYHSYGYSGELDLFIEYQKGVCTCKACSHYDICINVPVPKSLKSLFSKKNVDKYYKSRKIKGWDDPMMASPAEFWEELFISTPERGERTIRGNAEDEVMKMIKPLIHYAWDKMHDIYPHYKQGEKLDGKEYFLVERCMEPEDYFSVQDFWRMMYSDLYAQKNDLAKFLIAKAMGIEKLKSEETPSWVDIEYKGLKFEVKCASNYKTNPKTQVSPKVVIPVKMSHPLYKDSNPSLCRQSDYIIFAHIDGKTFIGYDPMFLRTWEFIIVQTSKINEICGKKEFTSWAELQKNGLTPIPFEKLKEVLAEI